MIIFDIQDEIAVIRLSRPEKAHAYTAEMLSSLERIYQELIGQVRLAIIYSEGHRVFCAGADLNEMKNKTAESALQLKSQFVFDQIAKSPIVSIAVIHGPAIAGGCELALACDLRVISTQASFSLPEVSLGLIPAAGGCTRLCSLLGTSLAKKMILGGETITAAEAISWGLAHKQSERPLETAIEWARKMALSPAISLKLAKMVLNTPSLEKERLAEAILYERKQQHND